MPTPEVSVVVATLFEPPTLGPLLGSFAEQGCEVLLVKGRRTNPAWNAGIEKARGRYVIVANDDIVVEPADFVAKIVAHHEAGYTWVTPVMWRNWIEHDREHEDRVRVSKGVPPNKGHMFSMDREIDVPPVPEDLSIYYGDDWFYWQHRYAGRPCMALDVQLKTGFDIGFEEPSGWTAGHDGLIEFLGETMEDVARREHVVATQYFQFSPNGAPDNDYARSVNFKGSPIGLLPECVQG